MTAAHTPERLPDALVALTLFGLSFSYTAYWPYNLNGFDEGLFLYEAKRILDGDAFYRDIFEVVTPGSWYLMALSFWAFGVSMTTARVSIAAVHGFIAVCMFVACRGLGTRRSVAAVGALLHVGICFPALRFASPHWFGTLFSFFVFLALLRWPMTSAARAALVGIVSGAVIIMQQQKGVPMLLAPCAMLVIDHWLLARRGSWRAFARCGLAYACGLLLVVGPVMLVFVVIAGFEPVFHALVRYPLVNYRRLTTMSSWGQHFPGSLIGMAIKYLSLAVIPAGIAYALVQWVAQRTAAERRPLLVALCAVAAALLSIAYSPGSVRLSIAAPLWLVLVVVVVDVTLQWVEQRWRWAKVATAALVGYVALGLALHLAQLLRAHRRVSHPLQTAFGRVDFKNKYEMGFVDGFREIVRNAPSREMFVYPCNAGLYLMTDTVNPTRFQLLIPGYSDPEQITETIEVLEARKVPFVVRNFYWMNWKADPIGDYLLSHYDKVKIPTARGTPTLTLFRRKAAPDDHREPSRG